MINQRCDLKDEKRNELNSIQRKRKTKARNKLYSTYIKIHTKLANIIGQSGVR